MIKLLYSVRLVLSWLAVKHMWSGSVVCSCLVFYNPIGSLKRAGQLVLCQSRLSGMDKPGWRESERERYIIALVQFAAKTSSSRYAYIHWQTSHSNMLTFMRQRHTHTHLSPQWQWLPSVWRNMMTDYCNSNAGLKSFWWDFYISCRATACIVFNLFSFWFTGDPRQSWPVCFTRRVSWSHAWKRWE